MLLATIQRHHPYKYRRHRPIASVSTDDAIRQSDRADIGVDTAAVGARTYNTVSAEVALAERKCAGTEEADSAAVFEYTVGASAGDRQAIEREVAASGGEV